MSFNINKVLFLALLLSAISASFCNKKLNDKILITSSLVWKISLLKEVVLTKT
jgi:hypothetical protein